MKKIVVLAIILPAFIAFYSCKEKPVNQGSLSSDLVNNTASAEGNAKTGLPSMVFADTSFDFGNIKQGDKVSHTFQFKNTGTGNLIITSASGSCGCTVPSYPKGTIAQGESGTIDVTFDSSGKSGKVQKTVSILTNCQPSIKIITITANISVPQS